MLDGGAGDDTLVGGDGNDTYVVAQAGDVVTELAGQGADLGAGERAPRCWRAAVENLTLTGALAINGTGNALANVITGNAAANVLNGLAGNDTLLGGAGNDTYVVAQAGDVASELFGSGVDLVTASVAWTLGSGLENLTLTGALAIDGSGNTVGNVITGNAAANTLNGLDGNDRLNGGLGNDTLAGGTGADSFVFSAALSATANVDTVTDFLGGTDQLRLDDDVFTALLGQGALDAAQFTAGAGLTAAADALQRIVYDTATGALYYDADGVGGAASVQFALLGADTHPAIAVGDFLVVA